MGRKVRTGSGNSKVLRLLGWLVILFTVPVQGQSQGVGQPAASAPSSAAVGSSQEPQATAAERLHLMVGRSLVISSPARLKRVSVADPDIADAIIVSPNQILINGKTPGGVSLVLWDELDQSQTFDLMVDMDILGLAQKIREVFPTEAVSVEASKDLVMLSGKASSKAVADKILEVVTATTPKVISLMEVPVPPSGEIMLEVKFAEVNRAALDQYGFNFFSLAGPTARTLSSSSTQQFAPFELLEQEGGVSTIGISDLLNIFVFRPDVDLGATIRALRQNNILQILAEPNLVTQAGKEASFLAGGEFPFPIVQSSNAGNAITIQFKEFGVRLSFTPTITPQGKIHLKVRPEVSALDFSNALSISGFLIPALSTRRVESEMELGDGQSFAIAGLVDDRLSESAQKIPFLGDIPILGKLFRSRSRNKSKTELLVMVTPRLVRPGEALPAGPQFPQAFLPPASPGEGEKPKKP